jgi:signal transduction histidine kinase
VEAVATLSARNGARGDAVRALFQQTPATLAGHAVGIVLLLAMYAPHAPERLLPWAAAAVGLWLVRLAHFARYARRRHAVDEATLLAWRGSWRVLALAQGAVWGVAAWLFWGQAERFHDTALILIVYAFALAAVQMLSNQPAMFVAFSSVVLLPLIARVASDAGEPYRWQLAGLLVVLLGIAWLMSRTYRDALSKMRFHKERSDELATQLRSEKAAAEAARRSAEAANRAKTQFFAAASHDLRQPLHALGLFAETLRQRVASDPEVAALVNSINESVDALEGLFGELLDITRIDTGGVEVQPQPVRLKEMFARLRLHFEPTAFEKGLALTLRGERHVAHCDPVILERILRNLVSNAIRYTEDGGVLVSARRRGDTLLIQVWDSGIGIPDAALPRIFDEFYQVQHNRPLQAHHRKGLGLGLAIVQRLAALIEAPLTVRSRVGRGTVFSLVVPVGVASAAEPAPAAARAAVGLTLQGRRIAVVEDEAAVRDGLEVLLKAWGASVVAFETVDDATAWARQASDDARPDLLIVDYRLPGGTTGIDALAALRARWPQAPLPAIVVTGSTIGGHEDEAAAHDFHLLIKPVLPNKLRAMIGFKLGMR